MIPNDITKYVKYSIRWHDTYASSVSGIKTCKDSLYMSAFSSC